MSMSSTYTPLPRDMMDMNVAAAPLFLTAGSCAWPYTQLEDSLDQVDLKGEMFDVISTVCGA